MTTVIEPIEVVNLVEEYVHKELHDADRYVNSEPLDESGIWSLHQLAGRIYAAGFDAGRRSTEERERQVARRAVER